MTQLQNQIMKLLWDYHTLKEEQIIKFLDCSKEDVEYLVANKFLLKDNSKNLLQHKLRQPNEKSVVAFEIVIRNLNRCTEVTKRKKYPIILSFKVGPQKYDVIAVKKAETEKLYNELETLSNADKIYIIINTDKYIKEPINTSKKCLICTYPPLKEVDYIDNT